MPELVSSAVIPAPVDSVWSVVRDFGGMVGLVPGVVRCHIEDGLQGSVVGCVRNFHCDDPPVDIRERLLALDDHRHAQTYAIVDIPLPIERYVAQVRLYPITQTDQTFIRWTSSFRCPAEAEPQLAAVFQGILDGAVLALQRRFTRAT
jgi:hypothetical protein